LIKIFYGKKKLTYAVECKTRKIQVKTMKKILFVVSILTSSVLFGQYRDTGSPDIKSGILNRGGTTESLFGFFNPDNFSMHHSVGLSYSTLGGSNGMALGVYTNSMMYKLSERLNIQTDISVINSPYNTFGKEFTKQINGVYLSRAQLNFKASDNMNIMIEYNHSPFGYYSPYYSGYSPYFGNGFYDDFGFEK
jgi:hypothetical protein